MTNPEVQLVSKAPVGSTPPTQTEGQLHPPVIGLSDTTTPAVSGESSGPGAGVSGTNNKTGPGVSGQSSGGDGIHGQSSGPNMSGIAGIHTAGGNGVYGSSKGNAGFFDGNVQVNGNVTVTGDVYLPGADCAEQFDFAGAHPPLPGTLLVMGETGALVESNGAYDKKVVGVVAGGGTYRPGIVMDKKVTGAPRATISLLGKAYCNVDSAYGAVEVGDLLTSSPTPGHAMKVSDASQAFGSVVGKALSGHAVGRGMIPILITLQ
jgi:hypothetical protein